MTLLGEADGDGRSLGGGTAGGSGTGEALRSRFESKINTSSRQPGGVASQSVRNDIKKSDKSGEKISRHTGRDDRATVEQVLRYSFVPAGGQGMTKAELERET